MESQRVYNYKLLILFVSLRIITISMPVALSSVPFVINIICLLGMYWITFNNFTGGGNSYFVKYLPICAISLLAILFSFRSEQSFITILYSFFQTIIWPLVAAVIVEKNDNKTAKVLLLVALSCYIITSITTIVGCYMFPQASRQLAAGIEQDSMIISQYNRMNIGGFNFVYDIALLLPLVVALFKISSRKLIPIIIFIVFSYAIVSAEYTTALLFSITSIFLFFLPIQFRIKNLLVLIAVLMLLFVSAEEFIINNIDSVNVLFGSDIMSERLGSVWDMFFGTNDADNADLVSRTDMWALSLQNFFSHPLLGTGTRGGYHSYIFDELSDKGILALLALVIMYSSMRKKCVSIFSSSTFYSYFVTVFVFNLLIGFVNPYNGLMIITFIIPLFACCFSKYEQYT